MRSDIRETAESLKSKIVKGTCSPENLKSFLDHLDAFIEAWCASADLSKRAAERFNNEAKEYALLRDVLKEMYGSKSSETTDDA